MRTDRIHWVPGALSRRRPAPLPPRALRHKTETAHLEDWLALARDTVRTDYALGARGAALPPPDQGLQRHACARRIEIRPRAVRLPAPRGRADAADWLHRLIEAALKDEEGEMLDGALKTVASLAADETCPFPAHPMRSHRRETCNLANHPDCG